MIDNFSILLSHALILLALWILSGRADLDKEDPPVPDTEPEGFARKRPPADQKRNATDA
ncbi:MAG: hypothetical protein ABI668_06725 [Sphingorhabdus sp.]